MSTKEKIGYFIIACLAFVGAGVIAYGVYMALQVCMLPTIITMCVVAWFLILVIALKLIGADL